jgi:predicted DCC family thiol-disulfide oxidoreductase YuxK
MVAFDEKSQSASGFDMGIIDLLYDSACPICNMEVAFLRKRDVAHRIKFTDLSAADYDPAQHGNVAFERGMRKIRAVMPEGEVVTGMEVFRQTYNAIGLGWMFAITQLPLVGTVADSMYDVWAENRLRITGRGELADVLKERAEALKDVEVDECDTDACEVDWD